MSHSAAAALLFVSVLACAWTGSCTLARSTSLREGVPAEGSLRRGGREFYKIHHVDSELHMPLEVTAWWPDGHIWVFARCGGQPGIRAGESDWSAQRSPDGVNATYAARLVVPPYGCVGKVVHVLVYALFPTPRFQVGFHAGTQGTFHIGRHKALPSSDNTHVFHPRAKDIHIFQFPVPALQPTPLRVDRVGFHGQNNAGTSGLVSLGVYAVDGDVYTRLRAVYNVSCSIFSGFGSVALVPALSLADLGTVVVALQTEESGSPCAISAEGTLGDGPALRNEHRFGPRPQRTRYDPHYSGGPMPPTLKKVSYGSYQALSVYLSGRMLPHLAWGERSEGPLPTFGSRWLYFSVDISRAAKLQIPFLARDSELYVGFNGKTPTFQDYDGKAVQRQDDAPYLCYETADLRNVNGTELVIGVVAQEGEPEFPSYDFQVLVNEPGLCDFQAFAI